MATYIPRSFIDELLSRINIVDIIQSRVRLKKSGPNFVACCPFHNEKTPSFSVSPQKQFFHCFGCGVTGNVISFVMNHDRLDFVTAVETLANHLGIEVPTETGKSSPTKSHAPLYALLEKVNHFFQSQLKQSRAIQYLNHRGLNPDVVKRYGIGYAPPGWDNLEKALHTTAESQTELASLGLLHKKENGEYYDFFRDRIQFPIRDRRGRVIGFGGRNISQEMPKYLNSPESPLFHKSKELYGLYEALQSNKKLEQFLIVEGYMDVVALAQYGVTYAVATLGTSTSKDHIRLLLRFSKKLIFCFDGDKAGRAAAWRALENLLSLIEDDLHIGFMFLPDGEDPDSFVRKKGKVAFEQRLHNSQSLSNVIIARLKENLDINSVDGKSHFITLATPILKQMPDSNFRYFLIKEMAQLLHTDTKEFERLLNKSDLQKNERIKLKPEVKQHQPQKILEKNTRLTAIRLVIAILLQKPELVDTIPAEEPAFQNDSIGYSLLKTLVDLLRENPGFNTSHLLEYFRDDKLYQHVSTLASWNLHIPETGIQQEFIDAWHKLKQQERLARIKIIMEKINQGTANVEEKNELVLLQKEKHLSRN